MTTYPARIFSPIPKLSVLACFALSFYSLISLNLSGEIISDAHLNQAVTITVGSRQIPLGAGTSVQVLQKDGDKAVISLKLQDGSPVITQISINSLDFSSPPPATTSSDGSSASDPQPASTSTQNEASSPAQEGSQKEASPANSEANHSLDTASNPNSSDIDISTTLTPEDVSLPPKRFTALSGYFYILIKDTAVPVVYSIPMEGKHMAKSASNLVFYGPWPGEQTKLDKNIVPDLVTHLGCSVFSFSFKDRREDLAHPETAYWSKESGWFQAALDARDEIIKGFGLERKPLILMGYSGGGGMVLNFAGAYPDEVDAVASQGANLAPEITQKNSVKWLIINNRGDSNASITKPFYAQLRSLGCNALYAETTPERSRGSYHDPAEQAFNLIYSFIAGVLDQRKLKDEGVDDVQHYWPYVASVDPLKRHTVIKTSDLTAQQLNSGLFDLLPSAAFALKWTALCPPAQRTAASGDSGYLRINFPAREKPKGIVLYYDKPDYTNISRMIEDGSSFAEHGCVVISPGGSLQPDRFAQTAVAWLLSQSTLKNVPIHLVGYNSPGASFISDMATRTDVSSKSLALIDFTDTTLDDQTKGNIENLSKECGMYGFYAYLQSQLSTGVTKIADELVTQSSQERGCYKLVVNSESLPQITGEEEANKKVKEMLDICGGTTNVLKQEAVAINLNAPKTATVDQEVKIGVYVHSPDMLGRYATIQLTADNKVIDEKTFRFNAAGNQQIYLYYSPDVLGDTEIDVAVLPLPEETPLSEEVIKSTRTAKAKIHVVKN